MPDHSEAEAVKQDAYPTPLSTDTKPSDSISIAKVVNKFPYPEAAFRIQDYDYYNRLFSGDHYGAFNIKIDDDRYTRDYAKLRYIAANIPGLISKIIADMIFSEPPNIKVTNAENQKFIDAVILENELDTQNYESALSNSSKGDAVYKLRVGPRRPGEKESTIIIEDISPGIYFPKIDPFNVRGEPAEQELAWVFTIGDKKYLRRECHYVGYIENHIHLMKGEEILGEVPLTTIPGLNLPARTETGIERSLIVHIPNWKTGDRYFGFSDYKDLDKLFYAINNRLSKVDNILDKHSDPILMVPQGVLDEKGNVRKKALGVIEVSEGDTGKPEYIVWDASLENAFKELEKLMEVTFMTAEISPDILGMGTGQGDSGKAIRMKVMRTIAKAARKKIYYDRGLKEVLYVAQLLAKKHNIKVNKIAMSGEPEIPEIEWQDGLPVILEEQVEIEAKRLDSGTTSTEDAIMRLDGVTEAEAKKKAEAIKEENKLDMPVSTLSNPFGPKPKPGETTPPKPEVKPPADPSKT